ncbi:MAG: hypothetical protein WCY21_06965 [Candidatus Cloacimonadaceae bacterium]
MPRKVEPKYNKLCLRCEKKCKQAAHLTIISCPDFVAKPVQMTVPLVFPRGRPRKLRR